MTVTGRIRRALAPVGVLALVATALVTPAVAGPPERSSDSGTFVDPFLSELCGTDITVSFSFRETVVYFEDGQTYPHQHLAKFRATITGPGGSLIERDAWREYNTEASATVTGLPINIRSTTGRVILRDAGYIKFTDDGVAVVHGPHPVGTGDRDVFLPLCSHLV